ncbi:MAG: hypothetical protein Q4D41_02175 [Prevotellaceae bacterium]|nr:hypothetical protein [Prevotellaceae bacterium]
MSKTYLDQIQKAQALVSGVRKNYERIMPGSVSLDELSRLEAIMKEGEELNTEIDNLRALTSAKVAEANKRLVMVKSRTSEIKSLIKKNFDITQWQDFGIMDKR